MSRVRHAPLAAAAVFVSLAAPGASHAQDVHYVAGSTAPRVQLTGEHFQIVSNGIYFTAPTPASTLSRYGVLGTDLGRPVVYGDQIVLLFGDTVGAYRNGDRFFMSRPGPNGAGDSIGTIPNADFSTCRYIQNVDWQLAQGVAHPAVAPDNCPVTQFLTNPFRGVDDHVFQPLLIEGLEPGESQATFRVPNGALVHEDRMYVFYQTMIQDASPVARFVLQSIVARSDQSPSVWSDSNPPSFTRLYTVSSHEPVPDPANPPDEEGDGGKFIANAVVAMDARTLAHQRLMPGLPRRLQRGQGVVFVWGRSWRVRDGSLYLAAFSLSDFDVGPSQWFYYSGPNQWSTDERDAAPLAGVSDVAGHSVVWNAALRRFVMLRDTAAGTIVAQFATTPWGTWTAPQTVFSRLDTWGSKLLHRPGNPIAQSLIPIYNRDGSVMPLLADPGVPYGPNLLERFTENADGSVTVYYTLSMWNPYQVFLMSSTFRPQP
jgi:hypothetical protein